MRISFRLVLCPVGLCVVSHAQAALSLLCPVTVKMGRDDLCCNGSALLPSWLEDRLSSNWWPFPDFGTGQHGHCAPHSLNPTLWLSGLSWSRLRRSGMGQKQRGLIYSIFFFFFFFFVFKTVLKLGLGRGS